VRTAVASISGADYRERRDHRPTILGIHPRKLQLPNSFKPLLPEISASATGCMPNREILGFALRPLSSPL
jgi:hypothetical protein